MEVPEDLDEQAYESLVAQAAQHLVRLGGKDAVLQVLGRVMLDVGSQRAETAYAARTVPKENGSTTTATITRPVRKWQRAFELLQELPDPWLVRGIHKLAPERCTRHRWNPVVKEWLLDDVLVKIESKPFAAGAMRECYAMKKLSTFYTPAHQNWQRAPNCVAKQYKKAEVLDAYLTDVRLQMDSKALAELYNKTDPPKKIDFVQCYVVVFPDRQHDRNVFCVEHLIEGEYIKYNSNSGYVASDDMARNTPQAFSHFTFEETRGAKLCADIQGVMDTYTDPVLHTSDGQGYGSGNLGLRGMALFFSSHECNPLCQRLKLTPFIKCSSDMDVPTMNPSQSATSHGATVSRAYRFSSFIRRTVNENLEAAVEDPPGPFIAADHRARVNQISLSVVDLYAPLHFEVARMACECLALAEQYPKDQVEAARQGGLFHLLRAAWGGMPLALLVLARVHANLPPSSPMLNNLVQTCTEYGMSRLLMAVVRGQWSVIHTGYYSLSRRALGHGAQGFVEATLLRATLDRLHRHCAQ